jgi:hypothetical protein
LGGVAWHHLIAKGFKASPILDDRRYTGVNEESRAPRYLRPLPAGGVAALDERRQR